MWDVVRPTRGFTPTAVAQVRDDRKDHERPNVFWYSVLSGAVATLAGAMASLIATGMMRVTVWCAVSGATAVMSGVAHDSTAVNACWLGLRRSLRWASRT